MKLALKNKKIQILMVVTFFFAFCLFQVLDGKREDWPFSYFGMFKSVIGSGLIRRCDLDVYYANGEVKSIYGEGIAFSYLEEKLKSILLSHQFNFNKKLEEELIFIVEQDILPFLKERRRSKKIKQVMIRFREWRNPTSLPNPRPDIDKIILKYVVPLELENK